MLSMLQINTHPLIPTAIMTKSVALWKNVNSLEHNTGLGK